MSNAIEQFNTILDLQIVRVLEGIQRQPDPMESAIGLSAHWSSFTLEDISCSKFVHNVRGVAFVPAGFRLAGPSECLATLSLPEVKSLYNPPKIIERGNIFLCAANDIF